MIALLALLAESAGLRGALLGPVGFVVAFFVGTVSFFSPCILPLLPGYLAFASGLSGEQVESGEGRRRVLAGTALFVLGFATMFSALGAAVSAAGKFLLGNLTVINRVAGVIVILMGLAFLAPRLFPFLEREQRPLLSRARPGVGGAYFLGLAFAVGWVPCVGPGLSVMISLGYATSSVGRAALLLFFFSLGFGVWFMLAALGLRRAVGASQWLRRHARGIQTVGGVFMVAIGILLVADLWDNAINPLRRLITNFAPPI